MDTRFVQERITNLRIKKGVSEYKMSLDLGHSKGYIQSISSGKNLPSISELLSICDYLGVTLKEFFDEGIPNPHLVHYLYCLSKNMSDNDLELLIEIAERLEKK